MPKPLEPSARQRRPLVTVVAPVHNEEANVAELVRRVCAAVAPSSGWEVELLLVDDGSTDGTLAQAEQERREGRPVGYLQLSRNFGHQAALGAGLAAARGDVVITMDADLQHPPEELPRMLAAHERGADVVQMVRRRPSGGVKGLLSRVFYRAFNRLAGAPIVADASDFRLLSRRVVDVVTQIPEREKFLRGLIPSLGFRQVQLAFDEGRRVRGEPSFSFRRSLRLAERAIFDYSSFPLRLVFYGGVILAAGAFLVGLTHAVKKLLFWNQVHPGFTDTITAICFLGGCTLLAVGVVGRYQLLILEQLRGRPAWIVKEEVEPASARAAARLESPPAA